MQGWLTDYWHQLVMAAAVIIWLVRVDSRVKANDIAIERMKQLRAEDLKASQEARDATNRMLLEIRTDIKDLIAQVSRRSP